MALRVEPIINGRVAPKINQYFETAEKRGAPNSIFLRVMAQDPNSLEIFYDAWEKIFYSGSLDHGLKEMIRVKMARLRNCGYWGGVRSAAAQQDETIRAKVEATWDINDPIFTPRERAALEMATIFSESYRDFNDDQFERWKEHFTEQELVELATFMAIADGFGKAVEMLGVTQAQQVCEVEL